jgi:hypothetical protein
MTKTREQDIERNGSSASFVVYEIRVKGHLDSPHWSQWFGDMTIKVEENGETTLSGPVTDQAALHGLLAKVRDLGLPLLSVNRVEHEPVTDRAVRN